VTLRPYQHAALVAPDGTAYFGNDGGMYSRPAALRKVVKWSNLNATLHSLQYYYAGIGRWPGGGDAIYGSKYEALLANRPLDPASETAKNRRGEVVEPGALSPRVKRRDDGGARPLQERLQEQERHHDEELAPVRAKVGAEQADHWAGSVAIDARARRIARRPVRNAVSSSSESWARSFVSLSRRCRRSRAKPSPPSRVGWTETTRRSASCASRAA